MSRDRRRSPGLDALEGKLLLSTTAHPHAGGHPPVAKPVPIVLDGTYQLGAEQTFDGSGSPVSVYDTPRSRLPAVVVSKAPFAGASGTLGQVHGSYDITGNVRARTVGGRIILTNDQGSIQLGFRPLAVVATNLSADGLSGSVRYRVVSGDGLYANARGAGTITISVTDSNFTPETIRQLTLHTTKSS